MKNFFKKPWVIGFISGVGLYWIVYLILSSYFSILPIKLIILLEWILIPVPVRILIYLHVVGGFSLLIISSIIWGLIGALIGYIIGKIKARREVKQ